jgi:hypothetical protein
MSSKYTSELTEEDAKNKDYPPLSLSIQTQLMALHSIQEEIQNYKFQFFGPFL